MQLLFELHFATLRIGVIHLHQCISSLLGWFCILNMHNHKIGHNHIKSIQHFHCFFMPSFISLNLLLCGVFWDKRFFLITSYELPITFPHQKFHNPKFPHLENYFCLIFQLQFEKDHSPFLKATLNVFLGFHKWF